MIGIKMDELKLLIAAKLDVTDFMDVMGWDLADLLDNINEEVLEEATTQLERAVR